jgi:hypothetical protein
MTEVRLATWADVIRFHSRPSGHWIAEENGKPVALGGFYRWNERLWATFEVRPGAKRAGTTIVLAVLRALKDRDEPVFVQCDFEEFPQAPRLLTVLGFEQTEEAFGGYIVWRRNAHG